MFDKPPGGRPAAGLRRLRPQEDGSAATDRGHGTAEELGHRSAQRGGVAGSDLEKWEDGRDPWSYEAHAIYD